MYPSSIQKDVLEDRRLSGEVLFYGTVENGLNSDWTVFFRRLLLVKRREGGAQDGESEFILTHNKHGIVLVEVKGGRIGYNAESDQYTSTDRNGEEHKIKNPFRQVMESMHSWRKKIKEQRGCATFEPLIGRAVCFPHCDTSPDFHDPQFYPEIVILRSDLRDIERKILSICNFWKRTDDRADELTTHGGESITKILCNSWQLRSPLGYEVEDSDRKILELTDQQFHIFYNILSRNRRAAICGGAGTGKTVLALAKAKVLAKDFRVLLTCFNRELALYLQQCASGIDNLEIYTFPQLCRYFGKKSGVLKGFLPSDEASTDESAFHDQLPQILLDSIDKTDVRYDAIIVDEAQDFHRVWLENLEFCLRDESCGYLYLFYDDNQNVYRRPSYIPHGMMEFPLTVNFRNTKRIHSICSKYYRGSEILPIGPIGSEIETIQVSSRDKIAEATKIALRRLVTEEKVDPRDIAVLTPRNLSDSGVYHLLKENVGTVPSGIDVKLLNVIVQSIHLFKGLERKVIILSEIEEIQTKESDPNLYVGTSRARDHLIVIATRETLDKYGFKKTS
jgi:hypothetical protein